MTNYQKKTIENMLAYFYTGECEIESNDLVETLELCQEYLIPEFK